MFSFFHRTPEIHLDCFTTDANVYHNTPIVHAIKTIPDWWKELPAYSPVFGKESEEHIWSNLSKRTAKDCYAIIELYKKGIVIESWTDFTIKSTGKEGGYAYNIKHGPDPGFHSDQIGNGFPDYNHIKLSSPWIFREKTGIKFLWMGAEWALDKYNIKVLPGVINFDIVSYTNVNIMFPKDDKDFFVSVGQPLVQLIPLSEKKLVLKNHLINRNEYDTMIINSASQSFYGWRKVLQLRKRNKKRGTCPFGFGD